jgi:hypothetical protein
MSCRLRIMSKWWPLLKLVPIICRYNWCQCETEDTSLYTYLTDIDHVLFGWPICMYVCVRVGHSNLALALRPSLICYASPLINPLLILHFGWNVGPYLWWHHNSHLVPWNTGPGDEILNKLWPHNHIGYVWLIQPLLGTFHKWITCQS